MFHNIHKKKTKLRFYGKYRAIARDVHDPERMGRIRMEIPRILGTGETNWSGWASACFPYGGSPDTGMFLVPPEGSAVWAEFENGKLDLPIWSGVLIGGSNPGNIPAESARMCDTSNCKDCGDANDHQKSRIDNTEHSKYHGHPPYWCPRQAVLLKTETGHTIMADDRHGSENLQIIDRAGQIFAMHAAVKPESQNNNPLKREEKTASNGDQIDIDTDIVEKTATISFTDLSGQKIVLDATKDAEKIVFSSQNKDASRSQSIELNTTADNEKITISGLNGKQIILVDSTSGSEKISITDASEQTILLDASNGKIKATDSAGDTIEMFSGTIMATNSMGDTAKLESGKINLVNLTGDEIELNGGSITLKDVVGDSIKMGSSMIEIKGAGGNNINMIPGMLSIKSGGILVLG